MYLHITNIIKGDNRVHFQIRRVRRTVYLIVRLIVSRLVRLIASRLVRLIVRLIASRLVRLIVYLIANRLVPLIVPLIANRLVRRTVYLIANRLVPLLAHPLALRLVLLMVCHIANLTVHQIISLDTIHHITNLVDNSHYLSLIHLINPMINQEVIPIVNVQTKKNINIFNTDKLVKLDFLSLNKSNFI